MISFLNQAGNVDDIFFFITGISVVMLVGITFVMILFIVKFDRKRNPVAKNIEGNLPLEIAWIVIPTVLVLAMFYYGWAGFRVMRNPPKDAMPVKVIASMWSWSFIYENGQKSRELNVPLNRPVKLIITSADVVHGLFIPAFRVKEDAVPGMETYLWFLPDRTGTYDLFCSEYCGVGHHAMVSKVNVMPREDFEDWYTLDEQDQEGRAKGAVVLEKNGCLGCHSIDGTEKMGPGLKGIFGERLMVITNGKEREITIDEDYLKRSILDPHADIVKGFPDIMPSQEGVISVKELEEIIDYIKNLK